MELADRTVMLLGGSGLVGHAVARRVLATTPPPRRLVLVALYEDEVRAAARALEPYRSGVTIDVEWGNIFAPASVARLDLAVILASDDHRALVLGDLLGDLTDGVLERSLVLQLLVRYKPEAVVDSINTATAFAYQDVFHSARALLERAQDGGVDRATIERHLMRLPMPQLVRHAQIMTEALRRAGTQAYVKIGTSGTGGMGFNIPYTHSEERPSATLLTKSAVAGAHTMLLFLLGRTPDAPITVEIKPTATIAWREVAHGPVRRKGKHIPLVDCEQPVALHEAFRPGAAPWRDLGRPLDGVYIDVGENGLFARDEFETVTALGQMEFITPEEVADYVMLELQGRPTGKDIVAALDASTAGPTYRAGLLRRNAVGRLRALEARHGPPAPDQCAGPRGQPPGGAGRRRRAAPGRRHGITAAHYLGGIARRPARRQAGVPRQHGGRAAGFRRSAASGAARLGGLEAGPFWDLGQARAGDGAPSRCTRCGTSGVGQRYGLERDRS